MQLISGVTLPEALPKNQIKIYYIKNLALAKANNGSFTKHVILLLSQFLVNENVLCTADTLT